MSDIRREKTTMAYQEVVRKTETGRCLLCHNAPCSQACNKGIKAADIIRSLRFENESGAKNKLAQECVCKDCDAPCEKACNRSKIDSAIPIRSILCQMVGTKREHQDTNETNEIGRAHV